MRGYDFHWEKISQYPSHSDINIITNDIRVALKELDQKDREKLVYMINAALAYFFSVNDILSNICSNPNSIEYIDAILCLLCLGCSYREISVSYVNMIISKYPLVLQDTSLFMSYDDPLHDIISHKTNANANMMSVFLRNGIDINRKLTGGWTYLGSSFRANLLSTADYFLEHGAKFPVETGTPNHVLIRKRRACRDAVMAVLGVFLRRCRFNKNVAINILKPMIWETRLDERWSNPPERSSNHKKRKE